LGGRAVAFHGYPRFTGDIDFLVRPTVENATRVLDVVKAFGFGDLGLTTDDFMVVLFSVMLIIVPEKTLVAARGPQSRVLDAPASLDELPSGVVQSNGWCMMASFAVGSLQSECQM
jgi:hypothetical protein